MLVVVILFSYKTVILIKNTTNKEKSKKVQGDLEK